MEEFSSEVWRDRPLRILSLDGGGVRGLFQAHYLAHAQRQIGILRHIDVIAGTSTGSVVAALLALGSTPEDVVELYELLLPRLFGPGRLRQALRLATTGARYSSRQLVRVLADHLPGGDPEMQRCQIRLIVASISLSDDRPLLFDSRKHPTMPISQAILASTAAPTYFRPHRMDSETCVDGGLWANSPTLALLSRLECPVENVHILSVGSCRVRRMAGIEHHSREQPTRLRT